MCGKSLPAPGRDCALDNFVPPGMPMPKPRLLILTQWFAPGYRAGGPIRSTTNLVARLANDFEISVVTSDRDLGMDAPYATVTRDEWISHADVARVMYVSTANQTVAGIGRILAAADADCIYLNSMFSPRFTLPALVAGWRGRITGEMVLAPRGELLPGALRYKAAKKTAFLSLLRASGVARSLRFHATDEQERESIVARLAVSPARVTTVANFPEPAVDQVTPLAKSPDAVRLLFLSRVSPKKNLSFLLERLQEVPPSIDVSLTIAGPLEDGEYWNRCARLIAGLPAHVCVEVVGAISHDDVRSLMARHHVFVLPTFGENYGHSIVEALGTGRPVLISDRTPWRGLADHGVGWDIPLEDPAAFTAALGTAARLDQGSFDAMCRSALAYAKDIASGEGLRTGYIELFTPR
jgi:glycosyltransferase involved in cell wall biosynthesis